MALEVFPASPALAPQEKKNNSVQNFLCCITMCDTTKTPTLPQPCRHWGENGLEAQVAKGKWGTRSNRWESLSFRVGNGLPHLQIWCANTSNMSNLSSRETEIHGPFSSENSALSMQEQSRITSYVTCTWRSIISATMKQQYLYTQ